MGCLGYFNVCIADNNPGIANASAPIIGPATYAVGPATFEFQLAGPGTAFIDARTIATSLSTNGYNAGGKFQSGGISATESGYISANQPTCVPSIWISAPPRIGTTINFCVGTTPGCNGCLLISMTEGPVMVAGFSVPIGLPFLVAKQLPTSTAMPTCFEWRIANVPGLVGQKFYFTVATVGGPSTTVEFSPAFVVTIQP